MPNLLVFSAFTENCYKYAITGIGFIIVIILLSAYQALLLHCDLAVDYFLGSV